MRIFSALMLGAGALVATAANAQQPAPAQPSATRQMPRADSDGDGVVSRAEVLAAAEARFRATDTDGNGVLSTAERDAMRAQWQARRQGGGNNGGGNVGGGGAGRGGRGGGDVATLAEALQRAGDRFDRMDTNRDGKLDAGERPGRRVGARGPRGGGLVRALGPDGVLTRAEMVQRATARFDRLDTNRDGKLDRAEIAARGRRGPAPAAS